MNCMCLRCVCRSEDGFCSARQHDIEEIQKMNWFVNCEFFEKVKE